MTLRTLLTYLLLWLSCYSYAQQAGDTARENIPVYYIDGTPADGMTGVTEHYNEDSEDYSYEILLYPDSAAVSVPVTIDQKSWNALTDDAAFHYIRQETARDEAPAEVPGTGAWDALMSFLDREGRWIIWILAGGIIIFVLYKILSHLNLGRKDILRPAAAADPVTAQPGDDIETLLARSLAERRITDAVSYMYQHIILLMQQRNIIKIRQETTNSEILRMTRSLPYHNDLRKLINRFEYVYFGEYPVSDEQFDHYRHTYQTLKQQLS